MRVVYSKRFLAAVSSLPEHIQKKLDDLVALLAEDPFHPLLHSKRLVGKLSQFYSFRVTRDWRVVFAFQPNDEIHLIKIGNRKDIYR